MKENLVLKVGTSTLTESTDTISYKKIEDLGNQVLELRKKYNVTLVSSGAIATAKQIMRENRQPSLTNKQALAAIGQPKLMQMYDEVFGKMGMQVAQCLLTHSDFRIKSSRMNTLNTINYMVGNNILPIINENDTIATEEIKFGDNDKLAAYTAELLKAKLMIICSDVNGLYTKNPKRFNDAQLIKEVSDISTVRRFASDSSTNLGTGGMISKLDAAEICMKAATEMWILNSEQDNFILNAMNSDIQFTRFIPKTHS